MAFSLSRLFKGKGTEQDEADPSAVPTESKEAAPAPMVPAQPTAAPPSVRTVMPKSAQPVSLREVTPRPPVSLTGSIPPPATNRAPQQRKITFPVPTARPATPAPMAPPPVAPGPVAPPPPSPPAFVAEAPDTTVTLELGDFLDRLPPTFLAAGSFNRSQKVEFRASELYSDLTKGRASVPASTIYAKCPEIFVRPVTDTEDVEVSLPLQKLVMQLNGAFQTRADQVAEENVGEIETPFLQVAQEDSERLPTAAGTVAGAIRPTIPLPTLAPATPPATNTMPAFPVRPQHRTGQISTITSPRVPTEPIPAPSALNPPTAPINPGKRPPSTVRATVAGGKIRLSGPSAVTRMTPVPPPTAPSADAASGVSTASQRIQVPNPPTGPISNPSLAVSKKTARIQIPPISLRPGGPGAAPRPGQAVPPGPIPVQASPVSIHPPAGTEMPVTFRSSPPPPPTAKLPPPGFAPALRPHTPPPAFPAIRPEATPAPGPLSFDSPPAAPVPARVAPTADDRKITLGLAAVLRGIPAEALTVEPWTVADDVKFSLPFAGIEKQLSLGRVSVEREAFVAAMPENYRSVLTPDAGLTEIPLPLPEIFQNLPSSALAIRADQVVEETGVPYPTPFSQKAEEDAQRLGSPMAEAPTPTSTVPTADTASLPATMPEELSSERAEEAEAAPAPAQVEVVATPTVHPPMAEEAPVEQLRDISSAAPISEPEEKAPAQEPPAPAEHIADVPADTAPAPVEEALAVLESTAPAEKPTENSAPTSVVEAPEAVTTPEPLFVSPPVAAEAPVVAPTTPTAALPVPPTAGRAEDSALQTLFMTEEDLDARGVVRHVCLLPGIRGCAIMFADGLRLAGNFPEGDPEGFSAMAPPFYKKAQGFVSELRVGALQALTIYTDKELVSFFMHEDICVSVSHAGRGFLPGVREKLETVTREMARMYSTTKSSAV